METKIINGSEHAIVGVCKDYPDHLVIVRPVNDWNNPYAVLKGVVNDKN